jgi:hypothetical protein
MHARFTLQNALARCASFFFKGGIREHNAAALLRRALLLCVSRARCLLCAARCGEQVLVLVALSGGAGIASAGTPRAAAVQNLIVRPVIVGAATPALPATFSFNPVIERPYICFGAPESPLVAASVYDDLAAGSSVVANIGTLAALIQDPPVTYVDDTGVTKYVACTDLSSKWPQAQLSTTRVRIEFGVLNPYAPTVTCELFLMRYGGRVCATRTAELLYFV